VLVLWLVSVGNAYNFSATFGAAGPNTSQSGTVSPQDLPTPVFQLIDATDATFGGGRADNRFIIEIVGGSTFEDHIMLEDDYHLVSQYRTHPSKVQYGDFINELSRDSGGTGTVYLEISW